MIKFVHQKAINYYTISISLKHIIIVNNAHQILKDVNLKMTLDLYAYKETTMREGSTINLSVANILQ